MSIRDLLPLYALGLVDDDDVRAVEHALTVDPELAAELDALLEAAGDLTGALPGVEPSPALRDRLLASTATRFDRFAERFAALFSVAVGQARALLALVDDERSWQAGPVAGSWLLHFSPSPALAGADTGFVRLAPGATFPFHTHTGAEHSLVLSGRAIDTLTGRTLGPGDEQIARPGTQHDFATVGDEPFVFAVWVFGVDFGG